MSTRILEGTLSMLLSDADMESLFSFSLSSSPYTLAVNSACSSLKGYKIVLKVSRACICIVVLKRYDHRIYLSPRSKIPKHSASLQNTYFHLNVDCARKKNPQFEFRNIVIHNEIKQNLSPEHKLLLDSLGIQH